MAALGDIEVHAVIKFTTTADYHFLDLPVYEITSTIDEALGPNDDVVPPDLGSSSAVKFHTSTPTVHKVPSAATRATQLLSSPNASASKKNKSNQRNKTPALAKNSNGRHVIS